MVCATVFSESLSDVLVVHEISKRDQFSMKLISDFENACLNLMNRHPSSTLDECFGGNTHHNLCCWFDLT